MLFVEPHSAQTAEFVIGMNGCFGIFLLGVFLRTLIISNFFGGIVNVSAPSDPAPAHVGTYPPGGRGGIPPNLFCAFVKCQMMSASACHMMSQLRVILNGASVQQTHPAHSDGLPTHQGESACDCLHVGR